MFRRNLLLPSSGTEFVSDECQSARENGMCRSVSKVPTINEEDYCLRLCGYHQVIHRGLFPRESVCVCVCVRVFSEGGGGVEGAEQFSSLSRPITSTDIGSRSRICRSSTPGHIFTTMALGAFAKLREVAVSFVTSVCVSICPSARMKQFGSHWTDFLKFDK